jgi:thioredoxin-dependent peroxiredoxin
MLTTGDPAPPIALSDQDGNAVTLSSLKGRNVLVFFYPKANTPGCTTQACAMRDVAGQVGDTAILGVSPDAPKAQKSFDMKHSLGFPLLADTDHSVAEAYGVWAEKRNYGKTYMGIVRSAFLVDTTGKIAHVWSPVKPVDTASNLLAAL